MKLMISSVSLIKISFRCGQLLSSRIVGYRAFERNRHSPVLSKSEYAIRLLVQYPAR